MPHTYDKRRAPLTAAPIVLICLALAACGSSSSSSSTAATNAGATTSSTTTTAKPNPPAGGLSQRFTALRECLQKNGVTLPKPGTPGFRGSQLPKGVTRAQFNAALKKCGGGSPGGGRLGGGKARLANPAFKQALSKFAVCLRQNGINVPEPNTSGKGPVFGTKGLNTSSAKFRNVETKCAAVLRQTLRATPGGTPSG